MAETTETGCPVLHFEFAPAATPGERFFDQLDEIRRDHPIFRSDEAQGYWVFTRNDIIMDALQDPETFSSAATVPTIPDPPYAWIPIMLDPPLHTRWRQLLGGWFSPGRTGTLEGTIRERCASLIAGLKPKGGCDFVADFASQFPTVIFLAIMGLPVDELERFMAWEDKILHFDTETDPDYSQMIAAMDQVRAFMGELITTRRADPSTRGDDLISAAIDWEIDGAPIPDEDLQSCLLLLFMAGLDTVASQLSYMFHHLATVPADREKLVADPSLIPGAVEEMLRAFTIVRLGRKVTKDVEFHGAALKAGDMVAMPLAFASRDEDAYTDATGVDLDRGVFRNLAFGGGPHRCLGSHLARKELVVALEEWHRIIPEYTVPAGEEPLEHSGNGVYGYDSLPLSWSV
jgi:cytochrome P450